MTTPLRTRRLRLAALALACSAPVIAFACSSTVGGTTSSDVSGGIGGGGSKGSDDGGGGGLGGFGPDKLTRSGLWDAGLWDTATFGP